MDDVLLDAVLVRLDAEPLGDAATDPAGSRCWPTPTTTDPKLS